MKPENRATTMIMKKTVEALMEPNTATNIEIAITEYTIVKISQNLALNFLIIYYPPMLFL